MKIACLALVAALTACAPWVDVPGRLDKTPVIFAPESQSALDTGGVVNWSGCWPGNGCTVVLTGHRTTYGGVFRNVATLQPGDLVRMGHNGKTHVYTVTKHDIVCCYGDRIDYTGDLMLLTSATNRRVHVIYAEEE